MAQEIISGWDKQLPLKYWQMGVWYLVIDKIFHPALPPSAEEQ